MSLTLCEALKDIRDKNHRKTDKKVGICGNLLIESMNMLEGEYTLFATTCIDAYMAWEHYSGEPWYPVPAPKMKLTWIYQLVTNRGHM